MEYLGFIVLSLMILLLMVLIHETGHYTAAKILGFTVDEFSIGFGPKIFSRRRKNGELFSVRVLPLGGYCAFYGEADDDEADKSANIDKPDGGTCDTVTENHDAENQKNDTADGQGDDDLLSYVMRAKLDEENEVRDKANDATAVSEDKPAPRFDKFGKPAVAYNAQKPWKRIIVLLGGVVFNFLSAIIFSFIYIWVVGYPAAQVTAVYESDGVPYCDLKSGDVITAVDGKAIGVLNSFSELCEGLNTGDSVNLTVIRDGETISVQAVRREITTEIDGATEQYVGFGFSSQPFYTGNTAGNAFKYCVPYTFKLSWAILGSFGDILTGKQSITTMSGPIGSINVMAEVSAADWRNILILLPLLASNLAIFNLLPFPALDGAHIVFTVIEWIRKKPINRKVEGMIHFVGMIVLLLFVLIVDILSFAL